MAAVIEGRGNGLGRIERKMGQRAGPASELIFEDCRVPVANRVGEEGDSLIHMMRNLEIVLKGVGLDLSHVVQMRAYLTEFDDFFPDAAGDIRKRIILKVSDFRSALVQGKLLASVPH